MGIAPLPIDPYLPEIMLSLQRSRGLVLSAPPGAGKTTRIPRALYEAGFADRGEILVLEPRRLAARLAASRVADEMGERPGETVGYSIRFENVSGPRTRIRFLTEAILSRRMISDPDLQGVSVVILDEFHERHLSTDLALAFLRRLQARNRSLRIIVMSATMEAGPVASYLLDAETMSVGSAPFDVSIEYESPGPERPLHERVTEAAAALIRAGERGDLLAFLPGAREIRRTAESLARRPFIEGRLVLALHGDLPSSEQRKAIEPADRPKIVLATNVAETSITIPGISAVIDSGLAKVAGHSAWSGLPTLSTARISKSSANQRAGRAGRTQKGRVVRLYTRHEFDIRPEFDLPEIRRTDLAETILMLHAAGVARSDDFPWFEAPPQSAVDSAETLLLRLGAVDTTGSISSLGRRMLEFPAHPRLARLILEGENLKVAAESALLAALVAERDIRLDARTDFRSRPGAAARSDAPAVASDLLELMERYCEAEAARFDTERLRALGLDAGAVRAVRRNYEQMLRIISRTGRRDRSGASSRPLHSSRVKAAADENALLIAVLAGFPDRVAKRRAAGSRELLMAAGGSATLAPGSAVHHPQFVVAVDAETRREQSSPGGSGTVVRIASQIEIEWLAGLFPDAIVERSELAWNEKAGRVEELRRVFYDQIALEERVLPATPSEKTSAVLLAAVMGRGPSVFRDHDQIPALIARIGLLRKHLLGEEFPDIAEPEVREAMEGLCAGRRSLQELASLSLTAALKERLTGRQKVRLEREAPERIRLNAGRNVKVHYEAAAPPWIESRLQDFLGMSASPAICAGNVPLTIHLLAPNGRAVQVTNDLAGFWARHYPGIRRELQRRYPRHSWPEIPSEKKEQGSRSRKPE